MLYLLRKGEQSGPYSEDDIRTLLRIGSVDYTDFVWSEGWSEWKSVIQVFPLPTTSGAENKVEHKWLSWPTRVFRLLIIAAVPVAVMLATVKTPRDIYSVLTPPRATEEWGENDPVVGEGVANVYVGRLKILLPTGLTNFTKETLSDPAIGSLDKFTAISGTRSVLVKHFTFQPSRFISPEKAASMSDEELMSNPSYRSTRLSTNVAGEPAIRLNTSWKLGNTHTEQDIVFFGAGRNVWEVHIFGIDDLDKESLQQMKATAFESITIQ
jgi:hypothetical protein